LHPGLEQELNTVLGVVSRAQKVFGGDSPVVNPPRFAPGRDLENDLGRGHFAESTARSPVGR
jgi:hypothetical protein